MTDLIYPKHKHPHGIDKPENPERIWVCEECLCAFTDSEARADKAWGHICKLHSGDYCESHLESYLPDVNAAP
jgi:hypothetical protein